MAGFCPHKNTGLQRVIVKYLQGGQGILADAVGKKSCSAHNNVHNREPKQATRVPKSHEILMFVCLQKDAKQCCDVSNLNCTHSTG